MPSNVRGCLQLGRVGLVVLKKSPSRTACWMGHRADAVVFVVTQVQSIGGRLIGPAL